jgi:hypothetical protein
VRKLWALGATLVATRAIAALLVATPSVATSIAAPRSITEQSAPRQWLARSALGVQSPVVSPPRPETPGRGLTEATRLAAIYDAILRARFAEARTRTMGACPPAPREACLTLSATALWWQIQIDPDSRALDAQLDAASAAARRSPRMIRSCDSGA